MAHFALLDSNQTVTWVVVVSNDVLLDDTSSEVESLGVEYCNRHIEVGDWKQTSYNNTIRRRYASPGMTYNVEHDAFILAQPYPSWTLDLDDPNDWVAPVPMPTDEGYWYEWDEEGQTWIPHKIEEPIEPSAG